MGSAVGVLKTAASRVGVSVEEYEARRAAGLKWCGSHRAWHPTADFVRDRSRGDGLKADCLASQRGKARRARDPIKEAARSRVEYAVRTGRLPRPATLACLDCGHVGTDRRHEYDHHLGYALEHHLAVEPVCTLCHADREKARRG